MRVLILHNRYRYAGGEDAAVAAEAALLRGAGANVLRHEVSNESEGPFPVLGNARLLLDSAWSRRMLEETRALCASFRPDVVHVHNFWMKLTPAVHQAARESGAVVVQSLHNYRLLCVNALLLRDGKPCQECVGHLPWRGVLHGCYRDSRIASVAPARMISRTRRHGIWDRSVDAFIVPSEFARARFVEAGFDAARLHVKPNFSEDPGGVARKPSASTTVVFAGRLSAEKGVETLLKAWALVARPGFRLVIAGDGPESAALRKLARSCERPGQPIEFAGPLSREDVCALLAESRVVVVPSVTGETFGMSAVEAFAFGRPAIVTDLGGQRELVEHAVNGYRVAPGSERELASAVETCIVGDDAVDRMGANARAIYLHRFTPERNIDRLMGIYRDAFQTARREMPPRKVSVLGTGVSPTSYRQVLELCDGWVREKRMNASQTARYAVILNVHSVMTARFDRRLAAVLNSADVGTPDGMPLVWALRSLGMSAQTRVYGPDLMMALCEQAAKLGHRIYLYGGREATLPLLRGALLRQFPALQVAGMHAPPFRPLGREEDEASVRDIRASGADIVFVGTGMPRQERWMYEHRHLLPGVVMLGVGAAFDFHAGRIRQAPSWMQNAGLEWLFRLCMEPVRLWKRYIVFNPLFLGLWLLERTGILVFPMRHETA
jgi:exopolysaccharide biosynthesis WecB/TagA/CpsF family protein